jgi:hypothetical protein
VATGGQSGDIGGTGGGFSCKFCEGVGITRDWVRSVECGGGALLMNFGTAENMVGRWEFIM